MTQYANVLTGATMKRGGKYNWKHAERDQLIYLGKMGVRHQFKKIGDMRHVWCEVLESDLHMIEETKESATPAPSTPNDEHVICPKCAHDFRAIPPQVQTLLLSAGFEPPFLATPAPAQAVPVAHFLNDAAEGAPPHYAQVSPEYIGTDGVLPIYAHPPAPAQAVPAPAMDEAELQEFCISLSFEQDDYTEDVIRAVENRMRGLSNFVPAADRSLRSDGAAPLPLSDAKIREVIYELRHYNPAADEYHGEHIHKGWAKRLEAALAGSDGAVQAEPVARALEFAEYMAKAGDCLIEKVQMLSALQAQLDGGDGVLDNDFELAWEKVNEWTGCLRADIYEFRKRATNASTQAGTVFQLSFVPQAVRPTESGTYLIYNQCDGLHVVQGYVTDGSFDGFSFWATPGYITDDFYQAWAKLPDSAHVLYDLFADKPVDGKSAREVTLERLARQDEGEPIEDRSSSSYGDYSGVRGDE